MTAFPDQNRQMSYSLKIIMIFSFGIAMAYLEATVVVYLRELFYPDGFSLPLKILPHHLINIEIFREFSTVVMLIAVAAIAGRRFWERFGYFIILFGVWDIFYYVWLNVTIGWPSSLFEWDILFLIPMPWIGPVIAPSAVALLMVIGGWHITMLYSRGFEFRLLPISWVLWLAATGVILYSFMYDTAATIDLQQPRPYLYSLLVIGLFLYVAGHFISLRKVCERQMSTSAAHSSTSQE